MRATLALLSFTVAGCGKGDAAAHAEAAPPPVEVATAEVQASPMPEPLVLVGTLKGSRQTDLAANATGRVVETHVERGSSVAANALLARLDVRSAAIAAAEAKANARGAATQASATRADCERSRVLLQKGALSQQDFDRIAAQCQSSAEALEAAEARAVLAAKNVGDGLIRAPFAGMAIERFVNVGEYVREDTKIVALVTLDPLKLELTLSESKFALIKAGQPLTFSVRAYGEERFAGTVRIVGGAVRETTRDVVVEAEVPNADLRLRPGMFARAEVTLEEKPRPTVPKNAVVERGAHKHVFVVKQGRAEERAVDVGASKEDRIAILYGLQPGERVVVHPPPTLQNGQAVK